MKRNVGKENGLVWWSFFKKETFPVQFCMFTETHSPYLSNWTPWYDSKYNSICIHLNGRQVTLIKKSLYMKMVSGIFVLRGITETQLVLMFFVGLPKQLLRSKSLIKLLEITDKCKMCNGCGNSEEYENLSSETNIFKVEKAVEKVYYTKITYYNQLSSILLKHDEPDKCPSCKNCNHYLETVMSQEERCR